MGGMVGLPGGMGLNTMPGSQMMLYGRGMGYGVSRASDGHLSRS